MRVEIEISDLAAQMFGEDCVRKVEEAIEREAQRLWYIERSKPKPKELKSIGRPPLTPEEKRFRELAHSLETIYRKREEQLGNEFESVLGDEFRRLIHAIEAKDLDELVRIEQEKPWVRKW